MMSKNDYFIQTEIEAAGGLKNIERSPDVYTVIEESTKKNDKNQKKSRVRREAFTGYTFNLRLVGGLFMIWSFIAVLPIRRGVLRLVRNCFHRSESSQVRFVFLLTGQSTTVNMFHRKGFLTP